MNKTFAFGRYLEPTKVELRPIKRLTADLRDHHLRARFNRLMRRWVR